MDEDYLVPGRECGGCTACCTHLAIATKAIEKHAGVTCIHCTGQGCAIYEERPPVCRVYHCLWRSLPFMDDSWRPDRSGVMMVWGTVPEGFPSEHAVEIMLVDQLKALESDRFAGMIAGFIESGTATFLNVPRGTGMMSLTMFMNGLLADAIARRDLAEVKAILRANYEQLSTEAPTPVTPDYFERARAAAAEQFGG